MQHSKQLFSTQTSQRQKLSEFHKFFFHQSECGIWLAELDIPLSIAQSVDRQINHLMKHAFISDCNQFFTQMHEFENSNGLIGMRFPQLFAPTQSINIETLTKFLQDNFQLIGAESFATVGKGNRKYFLNDLHGVVEGKHMVRIWGKQKELTSEKSRGYALKLLTHQELAILKSTIEGKTLKEIGREWKLNPKTVDSLRSRLKTKLGVSTLPQLIFKAYQLGIDKMEC